MTYKLGIAALFAVCVAVGQPADNRLSFEVAAVRPAAPITAEAQRAFGMQVNGAQVDIAMMSLADLIRQAYRLKTFQLSGPEWMSGQRYDIHAKLPSGSNPAQAPEMLQTLLVDRFKLTFHRESQEIQVYALLVGKSGFKLKEVEPDPPGSPAQQMKMTFSGGMMHQDRKMTMPGLCDFLGIFADRPVVDMTGLSATYQVALDIPADELKRAKVAAEGSHGGGDSASEPSGGATMFAAIQQLGLKLEARKAPVDVLVVDHAEKVPTEN